MLHRLPWALALALVAAAVGLRGAEPTELVRGAVSGGVASTTDGSVILEGTIAEAGVVGRTGDGSVELIEGFWLPPLVLLDADLPVGPLLPTAPEMRRPMPNPLRAATVIPYAVSEPGTVRMHVYDIFGRRVRTLVDRPHMAGWFLARWDGRDTDGLSVGNGVYYVRTRIGDWARTTKVVVTR